MVKKRLFDFKLNSLDSSFDNEKPIWVEECYQQFISTICSKEIEFPCFFAEYSYSRENIFFSYLEKFELSNSDTLIKSIDYFLEITHNKKHYPALILFINTNNNKGSLQYYENVFWDIVNCLNMHNTSTVNPSTSDWKLFYKNIPLFINGHSKAYLKRKSRWSPCDVMLVIQRYENLMDIQEKHVKISNHIRKKVYIYDQMPISKVFGRDFSDENSLDWQQFWLTDDNTIETQKECPLIYEKKIP